MSKHCNSTVAQPELLNESFVSVPPVRITKSYPAHTHPSYRTRIGRGRSRCRKQRVRLRPNWCQSKPLPTPVLRKCPGSEDRTMFFDDNVVNWLFFAVDIRLIFTNLLTLLPAFKKATILARRLKGFVTKALHIICEASSALYAAISTQRACDWNVAHLRGMIWALASFLTRQQTSSTINL